MKCLVFIMSICFGGLVYAAGCNELQVKVLKEVIQKFLEKSSSPAPKPTATTYNCYVPSPNTTPWENNVAAIFPIEINGLPFFDDKTNCRYWTYQKKTHIVCHIKNQIKLKSAKIN